MDAPRNKADEELLAKSIIHRHAQEAHLLKKADGALWLQYLPLLALAVLTVLTLLGVITISPWNLATLAIMQVAISSITRRIEATLKLYNALNKR